jgi:hypothetical protein
MIASIAIAMRTSKASAADGYRTKRCINVKPATPKVERVARDRLEGNPVANATLENQLESAGAFAENGWTVLGNAALKNRVKVVIDITSATSTDPCVATSQAAVPAVHIAPAT